MSSNTPFHPFKAVAIDLDGTLLASDLSISAANRSAIERLHENGVHVILASGRHHISMLPFARLLPQVEYMVSSQGAFASDVEKTTTIFECHLHADEARTAIEFGLTRELSIVIYTANGIFTLNSSKWIEFYSNLAGLNPTFTTAAEVLKELIFKVVYFEDANRLDQIETEDFIKNTHLYTVRSLENIFEIAHADTSKKAALQALLDYLSIRPEEAASFGDGNNDIPMFELTSFSCAMDHAWPEAKRAATRVAPEGDPAESFARAVYELEQFAADSKG